MRGTILVVSIFLLYFNIPLMGEVLLAVFQDDGQG